MHPNTQIFSNFGTTLRTLLRSSPSINFGKKLAPFPAHILDEGTELTEPCIKHVLAKHARRTNSIVQIFHKDHIGTVAKCMSLLEMKVLSGVVNCVVHPDNLDALFLVIVRPFLLSTQSALQ